MRLLSAAMAGAGIARLATEYTEPHVRSGRLVRLLEGYAPTLPAWHIYYPSRRYVPPALRAFLDFYRDILAGK
ncbi:MAG: LysR substrate-binding domain-containing protein [Oceanibaculum nanhaiense]|uniref:LysR substrate-binding domain-containing protein n=1 Tax=Oceanibaculum nanhaiense TaxID=1909734 RepID=UPI0025A47422|nr:LysR substrate-binding domain-containing protein [Oceanibaculum nanhaiense]MDM7946708.1 LysR substrate-binding domain-containing protein [Oceanibaculum nanhaiense]